MGHYTCYPAGTLPVATNVRIVGIRRPPALPLQGLFGGTTCCLVRCASNPNGVQSVLARPPALRRYHSLDDSSTWTIYHHHCHTPRGEPTYFLKQITRHQLEQKINSTDTSPNARNNRPFAQLVARRPTKSNLDAVGSRPLRHPQLCPTAKESHVCPP